MDKAKRKAAQIAQAKQASKHKKFDTLRNEGRVYATLVMDTSLDYNKDALAKIKKNSDKIAGLSLRTKTDDNGDQIIMTIKTNLAGKGNTNAEIHMNDLQQNLLTIEYISRTLVVQQNTAKQEALQKESEQNAKEKKEMNQL